MSMGRVVAAERWLRVGACLSLTGKYARFGVQAARALEVWRSLDGAVDLVLEDDRSEPRTLEAALPSVARRCDLLLGPYSTQLARTAGRVAAEAGWLLWNHGGSGDDVEAAYPGHVVSVLTPTSRYSEPFLRRLTSDGGGRPLWMVHGRGSFGRQVAAGAEATALRLGVKATRIGPGEDLPSVDPRSGWDLFSAGLFEEDVQTVKRAMELPCPPQTLCAVAAGVQEFSKVTGNVDGIYGVGQWFPGRHKHALRLGPTEGDFIAAYWDLTGTVPDYPAAQSLAGAVLAAHCARQAGDVSRDALWSAATALDTETLFGGFRIDPTTGTQVKHEALLLRWTPEGLTAAS
jgi:ABC-type branched-subunit amino acid transport system substrate-binding protein